MKRLVVVVLTVFTAVLGYAQDFKQTPQFRTFTFTYPQPIRKGFDVTGRVFVSKPVRKGFDTTESVLASKPAYRSSQIFVVAATVFDMIQTKRGMDHPRTLVAHFVFPRCEFTQEFRYPDKYFREQGWARRFGANDTARAVAANSALSAVVLSRAISFRSGAGGARRSPPC